MELADQIVADVLKKFSPIFRDALVATRKRATHTQIVEFRFRGSPFMLNISQIASCLDNVTDVSWQENAGGHDDRPAVVFQGSKSGKLVQIVFVLQSGDE
jgi:hypothetical protein